MNEPEGGGGASRTTEAAAGSSAPTDVSLREYMELHVRRLADLIDSERNLRLARRQDDLAAIDKAEQAVNKRLEAMNELRQQITEERSIYMSREAYDRASELILTRISALERWQFKIIGALVLVTFLMPAMTALAVYLLTRTSIPVVEPQP